MIRAILKAKYTYHLKAKFLIGYVRKSFILKCILPFQLFVRQKGYT